MSSLRVAALIPTFDNPRTIRAVVEEVRTYLPDVLVVDDGSDHEGRQACQTLAEAGLVTLVRREQNGGKGAAVKTGLRELARLGYSHAFQVDADGQHTLSDMPRFLAAAHAYPEALVLGTPQFDHSAPRSRRVGRKISCFWANVETLGQVIDDPLCGFRIYPIEQALRASPRGDAMDFDPEIAVSIAWQGAPVLNLATRVRYLDRTAGGVSHFRLVRDNVLISWMHTRMVCALFVRLFTASRPRQLRA